MTSSPILNPEIPFVGAVEGGLSPGKLVNVRGRVPDNAVRFAINYQLGPNINPRDDIAIHLSPRFSDGIITRNHINSMSWGPEENSGALWIQPGQAFEIIILCEPLQYKIAINGRHYTEFAHRLPYQRVTHLVIDGDVEIISVFYENINIPSSAIPPNIPAANFGPPVAGGLYPTLGPQVPSTPQGGNNYYPNPPNTPSAYGGYNPQAGYEKPEDDSPFSLDKVGLAVGGLIAAGGVAAAMNAINKKKNTEDDHEKTDSSNLQNESSGSLGGLGALGAALASSLASNALKGDSHNSQGYPSQDSGAGGMLGSILNSLGGSDNSSNRNSSNDLGGLGGLGSLLGGVLNKGNNQQSNYEPSGGYSKPSQSDNTTSDLINSIGGSLFSSALDSLTKHKSHGNDKPSSYPQKPPQYEDNYGARNDIPPPYQPVPIPPSPSDNKLTADEISKGLGLDE